MKHAFRLGLLAILVLISLSCSESKMLMKGLSHFPQPLGYELISPIDSSLQTDSVILTFLGFPMDSLTTVQRNKSLILPFLFINYFEFDYRIKLGANQLQQDYNEFFFQALTDESQRSGRFALCDDSARSKDVYNLEITMDTCLTETKLTESTLMVYYLWGYFSTYSESSYPAQSKVGCTLKLRKGEQLLRDTTFTVTSALIFTSGDELSRNERLNHTAGCMVATLCQSTRDCISAMIQDVNTSIAAQKR